MLRYVTLPGNDEPRVEIIHDMLARQLLNSKKERKLQQQAAALRKQRFTAAAIIAIILAIGATFFVQYRSIVKERNNMYKMQSHYITEKAERLIENNDLTNAIRILLPVLPPKTDNSDRPLVAETEYALRNTDCRLTQDYITALYRITESEKIMCAEISPKNKYIATSTGNNIRITNTDIGSTQITINTANVHSFDFSPDEKYILVGYENGDVKLWNIETGKQEQKIIKCKYATKVRFSPNEKYIVTASYDSIKILDSNAKNIQREINIQGEIDNIEVSLDEKYLGVGFYSSYDSYYVKIFNIETGKQVGNTIKCSSLYYSSFKFSPTGKYYLTIDKECVNVWETETGKLFGELLSDANDLRLLSSFKGSQFTLNEKYIYKLDYDSEYFWDFSNSSNKIFHYNSNTNTKISFSDDIQWSKDMKYFVTNRDLSSDPYMTVYKRNIKNKTYNTSDSYWHQINPDGTQFLTTSKDSTLRIWDANGNQIGKSMKHHNVTYKANYSHDGKNIVTHSDSIAYVWNVETNSVLCKFDCKKRLRTSKFSPNGKKIIVTADSIIYICDIENKTKDSIELNNIPLSASFDPKGKHIIFATRDSTVIILDAESKNVINMLPKQNNYVSTAEFSPDGKYIITEACISNGYEKDAVIKLWDSKSLKQIGDSIKREHEWSYIQFSPDSKYFIVSNRGCPYVYHTETAKLLLKVSETNSYNFAKFNKDVKSILLIGGNKIKQIEFPTLQELLDKYNKLFKDWPLSEEELIEYKFK